MDRIVNFFFLEINTDPYLNVKYVKGFFVHLQAITQCRFKGNLIAYKPRVSQQEIKTGPIRGTRGVNIEYFVFCLSSVAFKLAE